MTSLETPKIGESYFGTITPKEGEAFDNFSTLGDPHIGNAENAVMDTDSTAG